MKYNKKPTAYFQSHRKSDVHLSKSMSATFRSVNSLSNFSAYGTL